MVIVAVGLSGATDRAKDGRHELDRPAERTGGTAFYRDATNAERFTRSSLVSAATTGFIKSVHSPRRAPVCMSYSCRAR